MVKLKEVVIVFFNSEIDVYVECLIDKFILLMDNIKVFFSGNIVGNREFSVLFGFFGKVGLLFVNDIVE